jgi:hypothetical protein
VLCVVVPVAAVGLGAQSGAYTTAEVLAPASGCIIASSLATIGALMVLR